MTYNSFILLGLHSGCFQNGCKLRVKTLWMPDSKIIPSLKYWLIHLCRWICWHCSSQEHLLYTDPRTCLPSFQSVYSACFKCVGIILIMYFLMHYKNKCIGVSAKARIFMPNSSYCCQTSWPWYSCPCWKASMALKATFFEKQHVLKYSSISYLFHSLFWK